MFACPSFRTLITGIRWYDFTIFFFVTHEFSRHTCCCMFPKTELWLKHFIYFRVFIYIRLSSLSYIMDMPNRIRRHIQNRDMPEAQSGRLIIMLHELRVPVVCTCIDCNCYSAECPYRQSVWLGISFFFPFFLFWVACPICKQHQHYAASTINRLEA